MPLWVPVTCASSQTPCGPMTMFVRSKWMSGNAVARVAGETAPLLFTSSIAANQVSTDVFHALPTLPVAIFTFADSADPADQARGWAAALVLIVFVLVANILAKVFSRGRTGR